VRLSLPLLYILGTSHPASEVEEDAPPNAGHYLRGLILHRQTITPQAIRQVFTSLVQGSPSAYLDW